MRRVAGSFPRKPEIGDETSSEAELGESSNDEPGPTIRLLRRAERWRGPAEGALCEPEPCSISNLRM